MLIYNTMILYLQQLTCAQTSTCIEIMHDQTFLLIFVTATDHTKPSSSSGDQVIVDSFTKDNPDKLAFKSM